MEVPIRHLSFLGLAMLAGCSGGRPSLFVDLRTDLVGGVEFVVVRTEHFDGLPGSTQSASDTDRVERQVGPEDDALEGLRIAAFHDLKRGEQVVRVRLMSAAATTVLERSVLVNVRSDTLVTVVMTRDCDGVSCPGEGDPSAVACLGGRCVDPRCTPENPEACPPPLCTSLSVCEEATAPCARNICQDGTCLVERDDTLCAAGQYCHPVEGCTPLPLMDAGIEPGIDAGVDAGTDANPSMDASPAMDAPPAADAGVDAGADGPLGVDTGTDAGEPQPPWPGYVPPTGFTVPPQPEGGELIDFAWSRGDTRTMYVTLEQDRVFRSTNAGSTWFECAPPGARVRGVAVDPLDPGHVFVGTTGGFIESANGCVTWADSGLAFSEGTTAYVTQDGSVYAGTLSSGLHRRSPGGSWENLSIPFARADTILVEPARILIAAFGGGVAVSPDLGTTWEVRNGGLPSLLINDLAVDPADPNRLYVQTQGTSMVTDDAGLNWRQLTEGGFSIAVNPANPDELTTGAFNDVRTSTDRGQSFSADIRSTNWQVAPARRLAYDPLDPTRLYAGTPRGVLLDVGRSWAWQEKNRGMVAWAVKDLAMSSDAQRIYGASPAGVLVSGDGGATFAIHAEGMRYDSFVRRVHAHPTDPNRMYAAGRQLYESTDGGQTFMEIHTANQPDGWEMRSVSSLGTTVYAVSTNRVLSIVAGAAEDLSARMPGVTPCDGGLPTNGNNCDVDPQDVLALPPSTLVVASDVYGVFYSTDGGQTFFTMNDGLPSLRVMRLAKTSDGRLFAVTRPGGSLGGGSLFIADAPGSTWRDAGTGTLLVTVTVSSDDTVVATTLDGFAISHDRGDSWGPRTDLGPYVPFVALGDASGRIMLGTWGYGLMVQEAKGAP